MSLSTMGAQLKQNWKSALSVALVSVPLSLSLSIASGAGPIPGIIAAIWAGLIAGLMGGSKFNIVGPAGALSGILATYALTYGPGVLPVIALGAGVLTLIIWVLKWDKYLIFVPSSVIHGFTLGVALTIGFGQLNFALGLSGLPVHEHLYQNVIESFSHIGSAYGVSILTFIVGLGAMFGLLKWKPKVPNTVVLAVLGIIFGFLASTGKLPFTIPTLFSRYGDLSLSLFSIPRIGRDMLSLGVLQASAVVAFVVVLETLISAKVADGMTKTKFNQRKEVLGVGLANLASGIFGGIPASGVFARTAINVKSGATSSWSQVINAVLVALIAIVFLPYFKYLPLPIIASILVYAAIRMVNREHFDRLYRHDKAAFWNAMAIAVITIAYDATAGILVGMLVALFVFARRLSNAQCHITASDGKQQCVIDSTDDERIKDRTVIYRFGGELTYITAKSHIERIHRIEGDKAIILNFKNLFYIDADGVEALEEIAEDLARRGQQVYITSVREHLVGFFEESEWYRHLRHEGGIHPTTFDALRAADPSVK